MLGFRYQFCLSTLVVLIGQSLAQHGCPEPYGVQTYPDDKYCDRFFKVNIIQRYREEGYWDFI